MCVETWLIRRQILPASRRATFPSVLTIVSAVTGPGARGLLGGVLFQGAEDRLRHGRSCGEVVTAGAETVLIGDVVDRVGGAIWAGVGVGALHHAGLLLGTGVLQLAGFLLAYAVVGFESGDL